MTWMIWNAYYYSMLVLQYWTPTHKGQAMGGQGVQVQAAVQLAELKLH